MAAVLLMGCELFGGGDSSVETPSQDRRVLTQIGAKTADFAGMTEDEVKTTLKTIGLVECASARSDKEELYVYNAPSIAGWSGADKIVNQTQANALNDVIKTGKIYIEVLLTFNNGMFNKLNCNFQLSSKSTAQSLTFLNMSKAVYEVLPLTGSVKDWSGRISQESSDQIKKYDKSERAAFVSDFETSKDASAYEWGTAPLQAGVNGTYAYSHYTLNWTKGKEATGAEAAYLNVTGQVVPSYGILTLSVN